MILRDAEDYANWYASKDEGDWNRRYIHALEICGFALVPWPEKDKRPADTMDAPLPVNTAPLAWSGTHIIIRRHPGKEG